MNKLKLILIVPFFLCICFSFVSADVNIPAPAETSQTFYANSSEVIKGTYVSGELNSTFWADGDYYIIDEEGGVAPALDFRLNFTGVTTFDFIPIKVNYAGDGNNILLQLWNYNSLEWDTKRIIISSVEFENFDVPVYNYMDYVNNSLVQLRYYQDGSGNPSYELIIDYTVLNKGTAILSVNNHNDLSNVQGGIVGQKYHLSQAVYSYLVANINDWITNEQDPIFTDWLGTSPLSSYVPYTGATGNVDLGIMNLTTTGTGTFGNLVVPSGGYGVIGYSKPLTIPTAFLVVQKGITPEPPAVGTPANMMSVQASGAAYYHGRDVTNDIDFLMGTSSQGLVFAGAMSAHNFQLRTSNVASWTIINSDKSLVSGASGTSVYNILTAGNVTANYFIGDGSKLTGIGGGGNPFDQDLNTTSNVTFNNLITKYNESNYVTYSSDALGNIVIIPTGNKLSIGLDAGLNATNAPNSNFFGSSAGSGATNAAGSNFFGQNAGEYASGGISNSNFFGSSAGSYANEAASSNFFGTQAGSYATNAANSNFFGNGAGYEATDAANSNFFSYYAGYQATRAYNSNFFGTYAGQQAEDANAGNFFGNNAGALATNAYSSNFFGDSSGYEATNAFNSNFFGNSAGAYASGASDTIFIGAFAGENDKVNNEERYIGAVLTTRIEFAGYNYAVNELVIIEAGGYDAELKVTAVDDVSGEIFTTSKGSSQGLDYVINDEIYIDGGNSDAVIKVISVDGVGAVVNWVWVSQGSGYSIGANTTTTSNGAGYDFVINIDSVGDGSNGILKYMFTYRGTGYEVSEDNPTSSSGSGSDFTIDILSVVEEGYIPSSIAIGRYAGTGGYSDSIAIGHGVINDEERQINLGNAMKITGIYTSDTPSSEFVTGAIVDIGSNNFITTGIITADAFVETTDIFKGNNAFDEFLNPISSYYNPDGSYNHEAWGYAYTQVPSRVLTGHEDVEKIIFECNVTGVKKIKVCVNKTIMVSEPIYEYKMIAGADVSKQNAVVRATLTDMRKTFNLLALQNNITAMDTNTILADTILTKSKIVDTNTDYTSKFKLKSDYTNKTKNPSYENIYLKDGTQIGTLNMETRVVNLEGYATDEMQCLNLYTKFEDYRSCMLGVIPKK